MGLLRPAKGPALRCLETLFGRLAATEEVILKRLFRHSKAGLSLLRPTRDKSNAANAPVPSGRKPHNRPDGRGTGCESELER